MTLEHDNNEDAAKMLVDKLGQKLSRDIFVREGERFKHFLNTKNNMDKFMEDLYQQTSPVEIKGLSDNCFMLGNGFWCKKFEIEVAGYTLFGVAVFMWGNLIFHDFFTNYQN